MNRFMALFSLFVILVLHQNCTQYTSQPASDSTIGDHHASLGGGNSGNGGSYDGKISYKRLIPGFSCDANNGEYASLSINGESANLITADGANCQVEKQIKTADLEFSKFTEKFLAYKEGLYKIETESTTNKVEDRVFAEAWCLHRALDGSIDFEIATEWLPGKQTALISYYDKMSKNPEPLSSRRELNNALVSYSNGNLRVSVQYLTKISGTYDVQGRVTGMIGNQFVDALLACRMGGQFDPEAPEFDYSLGFETFAVGQSIAPIVPSLTKSAQQFKISPALPNGITFDTKTGSIAGTPLVTFSRSTFKVSAVYGFGEIDRSVSIAAGRAVKVNSPSSVIPIQSQCNSNASNDCTLAAALSLGNSVHPLPLVVELPVGRSVVSEPKGYLITGDISIVGNSIQDSKIDGENKGRHFQVQGSGFLKLSNMTLENGVDRGGGSILVTDGSLNLNTIAVKLNKSNGDQADSSAHGGAIRFSGSDLIIKNSSFMNNSAPRGYGGAVYAMYASSIIIKDSEFQENLAYSGGAVYVAAETFDVLRTRFIKNSGEGGAIYVFSSQRTKISNSLFLENRASFYGGAIFVQTSQNFVIQDSTVTRNLASTGSALYIFTSPPDSSNYIFNSTINENAYIYQQYFPNLKGTTLHLHSGRLYLRGVRLEKNKQVENCATSFQNNSLIGFVSLGQNTSDDTSCAF